VLALAAGRLERGGFGEAAGIAALLAVSLVPALVWAIESLTGWWPAESWGAPYYPAYEAAGASRWVVAELATILAALLVLRRRPWVAAVFPIAAALFGLVLHAPRATGIEFTPVMERWTVLSGALLLCAVADTVDRVNPRRVGGAGRGDMAFALWLVGMLALSAAILAFWPTAGVLHHALPLLALGVMAAALAMGRRTLLVFGVLWIFLYLVYLAAEVFRSTPYFPLALAGLGGALLFATVWLQRRFPGLVRNVSTGRVGRGGLPGSSSMPWIVAAAGLCATLLQLQDASDERLNRAFRERFEILRMHSGSRRPPSRPVPGTMVPRPERDFTWRDGMPIRRPTALRHPIPGGTTGCRNA
jgi:hypothetical protein